MHATRTVGSALCILLTLVGCSSEAPWATADVTSGTAIIATGGADVWSIDFVDSTFDAQPDDVEQAHMLLPPQFAELTSWYFGAKIDGAEKLLIWTSCNPPTDDGLEKIPFVVGGGDCYAEGVYDLSRMSLDRYGPNGD